MTDLNVEVTGTGDAAVLVHGSWGWGSETFPHQRLLVDRHRIFLVDRRGFGRSPGSEETGWARDADDLTSLMERLGRAHLVGHSYGGVSCLLTATRRPDLVRSLVIVEPPAFGLAEDREAAAALASTLEPVYRRASGLTTEEFVRDWGAAVGRSEQRHRELTAAFSADDWAAAEASRRERWPGDAPIDLHALAASGIPVTVVAGRWDPQLFPGGEPMGRAFAAISEAIRDGSGARLEIFAGSSHNPQLEEPERFNELLRDVWSEA